MKPTLTRIFMTVAAGICVFMTHAQNCDMKLPESIQPKLVVAPVKYATKSSDNSPALDACRIDYEHWQRLSSANKVVWDIRDLNARTRRPISDALAMTPASLRGVQLPSMSAVLLVGSAIDTRDSEKACYSLRENQTNAYALVGGERALRAKQLGYDANLLLREAELDPRSAALWLNDESTTWVELVYSQQNTAGSQPLLLQVPRTEDNAFSARGLPARKIYLVTEGESELDLLSTLSSELNVERVWWVRASRLTLELFSRENSSVAFNRNQALTKPCGVN